MSAAPLPSSTVILLREEPAADGPFSVLLLERHGSIAFPGAHAFPGGIVEPGDDAVPGDGAARRLDRRAAAPAAGGRALRPAARRGGARPRHQCAFLLCALDHAARE